MEFLGTILVIGIILYGIYSFIRDVDSKGLGVAIAEIIFDIILIVIIIAIG